MFETKVFCNNVVVISMLTFLCIKMSEKTRKKACERVKEKV